MAMLIAWQAVNAARHPNSKIFSNKFLIVVPGITIRDRLRVLLPNDLESYYRHRTIVPSDMLGDIDSARIKAEVQHWPPNPNQMVFRETRRGSRGRSSRRSRRPPRERRFALSAVGAVSNVVESGVA